ncbi:concanavalin A-like lectin/glucanase domain-containing protein [Nemania diffusa]|nr:concanavalin A-like lectin/glucanase domain-containing protein [Nemania diffusa]
MPKREFISLLSILGFAAQLVNGQLEPDCNPLHADCPAKKAWPEDSYYIDFTKETGPPENWIIDNNEAVNFSPQGAEFTYGKRGDAPNMWTDFYMLGGRYDVEMQIAPGQGIISNSVLFSDIQDEIDWEFSGNQHGEQPFPPPDGKWTVGTNVFAQGQMWDGAATYQKDAYKPTTQFHTYSVDWDESHISWYVDNQVVRSVQASNIPAGSAFPQSPMKLQLGVWGGGDPANNYWTIQWAGGEVDMKGAPYTMYVRSVNITNKYPACGYKYTDRTTPHITASYSTAVSGSVTSPSSIGGYPVASSSSKSGLLSSLSSLIMGTSSQTLSNSASSMSYISSITYPATVITASDSSVSSGKSTAAASTISTNFGSGYPTASRASSGSSELPSSSMTSSSLSSLSSSPSSTSESLYIQRTL